MPIGGRIVQKIWARALYPTIRFRLKKQRKKHENIEKLRREADSFLCDDTNVCYIRIVGKTSRTRSDSEDRHDRAPPRGWLETGERVKEQTDAEAH